MSRARVIIVGAGPGGCAAGVQCARLGVHPLILDCTGVAGGLVENAWRVENYPGLPPLPGRELARRLRAHVRRFGLGVTRARVQALTPASEDELRVETDRGSVTAAAVILATGTFPLQLEIPGARELSGHSLFYEVRDLLRVCPEPRRVSVIGGGEAALDYALTLAGIGAQVAVLLRGARPRAGGRLLALARAQSAVTFVAHARPLALHEGPAGARLEYLLDGRSRVTEAGPVLAAIGRRSAAPELLDPLGIASGPGIGTSRPGLFVIGDARHGALGQAGMAAGDGLAAAMEAVGHRRKATAARRRAPRPTRGPQPAREPRPARDPLRIVAEHADEDLLRIVAEHGNDDLARVFVAATRDGSLIECVESTQPPIPREQKWVLIVSTLKGCPIACPMCDAGGDYRGRLTSEEIFAQIDFLIRRRYPDGRVPVPKLKVQFARMGDPALNDAVLEALRALPARWELPGLVPSISTIAPAGRERFFEELLRIKNEHYAGGRFQMQFSLHTTDERARRALIPARTWSAARIATYGQRFHTQGDRKVTLNFAAAVGLPLEPSDLLDRFDPRVFLVKLTPINPTRAARRAGLRGVIDESSPAAGEAIAERFRTAGYETIVSIGEVRENEIGSNCGMYVAVHRGQSDRAVEL